MGDQRDRKPAALLQLYGVVDTPRRARSSISEPAENEIGLRSELIEIRLRRSLLSRDLAPPDDAGNAESFSQQLLEAFFQLIRLRFAVVQQSHNFTTQIGESWTTGTTRP